MKAIALAAAVIGLSGCAGSASTNGPGKLPEGVVGGIWTAKPTEQVASCLQQQGVAATYRAVALQDRNSVYTTVITPLEQRTEARTDERVFACV